MCIRDRNIPFDDDSVMSVFAVDSQYAWMVTSNNFNSCQKTSDGGASWIISGLLDEFAHSCYFLNYQTGWMCAKGYIYYTTTAGNTINHFTSPDLTGKVLNLSLIHI